MAIFDFKLACGERTYNFYKKWIEEFRDRLYYTTFPREDEREPFENITERVKHPESIYPLTNILLAVDPKKQRVAGGCVVDYHYDCNSVLPIYLVVAEEYRRQGLGRTLLEKVLSGNGGLRHCFVEVDNPNLIADSESPISPADRIEIYEKWGFKPVPLTYYQPPLAEDKDYETNLLLMHRGENLSAEDLKTFLKCFYKGLGYENSEKLTEMYEEIDKTFVYLQ